MSRYTVIIEGREWSVDVDGDVARIDGREVRLLRGAVGGVEVVDSVGRRLEILPQPHRDEGGVTVLLAGRLLEATVVGERCRLRSLHRGAAGASGPTQLLSEIPGIIRRVLRDSGDAVEEGDTILTLEAMKMENEIRSAARGHVASIHVKPGQKVGAGELLAVIEPR